MLLAYSLHVDTPTILYFILAFLGVAALALYLIIIALILRKVSFILGTVLIGVRAIAMRTQPLSKVVQGIAGNVGAISSALGVALGEEEASGRRAAARPAAAPRKRSVRTGRGARPAAAAAAARRAAPAPPPAPVEEEEVEEAPEEEVAAPAARAPGRPPRVRGGGEPGEWDFV